MGLERGYTALNEDEESRNIGRIADRGYGRKIGGGKRRNVGDKKEKNAGGGGKTRKVETTCRNNVRVFDLRHVTEPH